MLSNRSKAKYSFKLGPLGLGSEDIEDRREKAH
jgi:hypothetical protein